MAEYPTNTHHTRRAHEPGGCFTLYLGRFLEQVDSFIYAIVGICFFLAAILVLIYTFWGFSVSVIRLGAFSVGQQPVRAAQAIIEAVSGLLLVLIIMEMLGTVLHYLRVHVTSVRPFLFIGIISATRSILSIGARLSVEGLNIRATDFAYAMIELSIDALVILALGITLKLLGRWSEVEE
ncbi:hypothetical protein KSF_046550 [Reticulibacter mediterranei]|uniref:Uncharacterized protein n=1 Tax=Reticulibacter mediterranei TaxID=2778369 RepID=A0A8J3N4Z6_9CHLR|nr:phosphate-starvation-inducible PsiE family protein [Reticulibacter mediterranei]GHO94607.1 hypothetical protein KSF_046550 [Reticulibacter mediterranei]